MPAAAWPATKSKCGVCPRITQPTHTMAAKRPVRARCNAACGSSNAPGTQCNSTSRAATPAPSSACSAPSSSRLVIGSMKRAATMAKRAPGRDRAGRRGDGARPAMSVRQRREEVAELVALGAEVLAVLGVRGNLDRYALDDGEAVPFHPRALGRIVGEQAQVLEAEVDQDLRAYAVVAQIGFEPQRRVRLDGVHAEVLQPVRADLVVQSDPASFLPKIDEDAASFLLDHRHRHIELRTAVTAQRVEDVAREAFGVHTHEHRFVAG